MGRPGLTSPAPGLRRALQIVTKRGAERGRPVLVGERHPESDDPRRALYPEAGSAGERLCRSILGMTPEMYLAAFVCVNLLPGGPGREWSGEEARASARRLLSGLPPDQQVIILGAQVYEAFKYAEAGLAGPWESFTTRGVRFLLLPHPSEAWDDPAAIDSAMLAVMKFCPQVYEVIR